MLISSITRPAMPDRQYLVSWTSHRMDQAGRSRTTAKFIPTVSVTVFERRSKIHIHFRTAKSYRVGEDCNKHKTTIWFFRDRCLLPEVSMELYWQAPSPVRSELSMPFFVSFRPPFELHVRSIHTKHRVQQRIDPITSTTSLRRSTV